MDALAGNFGTEVVVIILNFQWSEAEFANVSGLERVSVLHSLQASPLAAVILVLLRVAGVMVGFRCD